MIKIVKINQPKKKKKKKIRKVYKKKHISSSKHIYIFLIFYPENIFQYCLTRVRY